MRYISGGLRGIASRVQDLRREGDLSELGLARARENNRANK